MHIGYMTQIEIYEIHISIKQINIAAQDENCSVTLGFNPFQACKCVYI